ncbi:hypothetical protein [Armatimonas sp.]|uniref:hypothetical protein n=1 Tax=Armatimonas sp. TaxID=1872638 RepID=UPI00286B0EEF|nr:hypothetical protein [Armatimonas sp.]
MKSLLTLALTVALTSTTFAQDLQRPAQQPRASGTGRSVTGLTGVASSSPDWFSKTINVDIKNATLADAIKKILEAADVKVAKIDDQLEPDKKNKLSLKLDGVNVRDALAAVSRLYASQAFVLSEDGKTTIELKNRVADAVISPFSGSGSFSGPGSFPFGQAVGGGSGRTTNVFITGNAERYKDLPDKKIDIKVQEGTALDVVKAICEKAGLDYELDKDLKNESKVSMTMTGVSVGNALDNAAGLLRCGWKAEKKGDKVKIYFGKKYPGPSLFGGTGRVVLPTMPELPIVGNLFTRTTSLPSKRVSLDKKSTDVRECLKDILQQADLSYALADDLPSDPKSFTFSNVPLATALAMICGSIDLGWSTEGSADGKPVVKVGKRYKGRSSSRSSFSSYTTMPSLTRDNGARYNSVLETYRTARPATQRVVAPAPRIPLECL